MQRRHSMIHGRLLEILQCDYELRACMKKNNHLDDNDWYEIIATMESNTSKSPSCKFVIIY